MATEGVAPRGAADTPELDDELPDDEQLTEYEIERHQLKQPLAMMPDVAFFAPGRDASGANERLFIRIAPRYRDWLASYANDKRFPFKGLNHLVRWCIDQGLRKLDRVRPTPTLSTQITALQAILYEEQVASDFAVLLSQTEQRINAYLGDGAKGEAVRLIQAIRTEVENMPDGYWKGRYEQEILRRWRDLIQSNGVDLGGTEGAEG